MSGIRGIIETHRARLENAGLMRQLNPGPLPEHIQRITSPHFRALAILRELPERLQVQPSPMAKLFEYTLPKMEVFLNELGETRAEQIVSKLCEHGKEMIEKYGNDGAKERLEELFTELPGYMEERKAKCKAEEIIEVYRLLDLEGRGEGYLKFKLKDKISSLKTDAAGMIRLKMKEDTSDSDLVFLKRAKNLRKLDLEYTRITDDGLGHLKGLDNLQQLRLAGTRILDSGLEQLKGLVNLERLELMGTQITDAGLEHLKGLVNLRALIIWNSPITDAGLEHLKGLINLKQLSLVLTRITDAGLEHLKGLVNLKQLSLLGTRVTMEEAEKFKETVPGVTIEQ